jgi:hypothetical protein
MSARDELALELFIGDNGNQPREASIADWEYFHAAGNFQGRVEHYEVMADAILTAGYTKPRTIPDAHLCQLSDGSYRTDHKAGTIVESADGSVWRFDEGDWNCLDWVSASLLGPATVLYEPTCQEVTA